MWIAVAIFAATYLAILSGKIPFLHVDRPSVAVMGAVLMIAFSIVTPDEAYRHAIDHATIVLLLGMMILTGYLAEAGFFRWASYSIIRASRTPRRLLAGVTLLCAILSAFIVNDTVCLLVTPLVLQVVNDAKLPPLPYLFAVAFGANAGSAATPTGNPQNMIVATLSGIPYATFMYALAPAALVSTLVVLVLLLVLFRRELACSATLDASAPPPLVDYALIAKSLAALGLVVVGFFSGLNLAFTALGGAALLVLIARRPPRQVLLRVDWLLLLFFAGLFVVVYGVGKSGAAELAFEATAPFATGSPLREATVLSLITVVASNLFSNVPFVMLAARFIPSFQNPTLAWETLALVSTLAGNLTLVGSVANLIVFELAGTQGRISFGRFLSYGLPITAASCVAGLAVLLALR